MTWDWTPVSQTIGEHYSCETELFEIELTICIKMDSVLKNLQWLICHKTQPTNQPDDKPSVMRRTTSLPFPSRSTQTGSSSTWLGSVYGSNRTVWYLTACMYKIFTNNLFDIYVKTGFGIT